MDTNSSKTGQNSSAAGEHNSSDALSADSVALFSRFVDGDALAADALFQRYADRLLALVRSRLSQKLAVRVAPDDVVMSAYRSFFVQARDRQFEIRERGAVWRLLVQITLHKLYRQVAHHQARRRSIKREESGGRDELQCILSQEPSPQAAAELSDEIERWFSHLSVEQRQSVEMRMQGSEISEIATALGRSIKTIRRHLGAAKQVLFGLQGSEEQDRQPFVSPPRRVSNRSHSTRTPIPGVVNLNFEDYLLQKQIGSGLTGKVYQAKHCQSEEILAIKYLKKEFAYDSAILTRFLSEARIVTELRHSGIIRLHGLGRTPGGGYFIAMDLAANGDLEQHVCCNRAPQQNVLRWLIQATEALDFAHARGIVHCDLKPSNLLLDAEWNVIVTDFGFAQRLISNRTSVRCITGTPAFMAPEQFDPSCGDISPATDVYGLGAVMFYILFGHPPHTNLTSDELLVATANNRRVAFPMSEFPHVPRSWIEVCQDCLEMDPSRRIRTMSELGSVLRATAPS